MIYISVKEFAELHQISERTVRNWCSTGKMAGVYLVGKTWNIPEDASIPDRSNKRISRVSPLLAILREQKDSKLKGSIYHQTQIDLTYSSNHMEGNRLSHEQTRYIFETNTIGITDDAVNVDDIVETVNHFRCIDHIIDTCTAKLSEAYIKELHAILKSGTSDSRKDWFVTGDYKRLPNVVGGNETCPPKEVHKAMRTLLKEYSSVAVKSFDDILDFHQKFESIHPFQDGNGRVGRLILFKECLLNGHIPFIITEDLRLFYYRGLKEWNHERGYLRDICLTAQDNYIELLAKLGIRI